MINVCLDFQNTPYKISFCLDMIMITYNFSYFDYTRNHIDIPPGTIFFRGIANGKLIPNLNILRPNVPIYVSSERISKFYCSNQTNDICVQLKTLSTLRLFDIRKIMYILPSLINNRSYNVNDTNFNQLVDVLKLTLGLCTFDEQISIYKSLYPNADQLYLARLNEFHNRKRYFNTGMRAPITDIDNKMTITLKHIFSSVCDGIISPILESPFDPKGFSHEEIILFDPSKVEIVNYPHIESLNIMSLVGNYNLNIEMPAKFKAQLGGAKNRVWKDKNIDFDNLDIKKEDRIAKQFAKQFQKKKRKTKHANMTLAYPYNKLTVSDINKIFGKT